MSQILALDQDGNGLIPLVHGRGSLKQQARTLLSEQSAAVLFPKARSAEAALAGLWLYFSGFDKCHRIVQDLTTPEGSFWHAIVHRREPDATNSAYWFRALGWHPLFPELNRQAAEIVERHPGAHFKPGVDWDPFQFVEFCELARRQPGSEAERVALEIQRAEWQLLFDYCARAGS